MVGVVTHIDVYLANKFHTVISTQPFPCMRIGAEIHSQSLTSRGTVTPAMAIKSKRSLSVTLFRSSMVLTLSNYKQKQRTTKDYGVYM